MVVNEEQIVGIYDADGGWMGELRYVVGVLAGRKHCSLCDITHGWNPWGRGEWRRACAAAPFDIQLIHRDQASASQRQAAGALPALIAGQNDSWRVLVDSDELEGCAGDADQLMALIESGVQTD